jgi:hypothetical protein
VPGGDLRRPVEASMQCSVQGRVLARRHPSEHAVRVVVRDEGPLLVDEVDIALSAYRGLREISKEIVAEQIHASCEHATQVSGLVEKRCGEHHDRIPVRPRREVRLGDVWLALADGALDVFAVGEIQSAAVRHRRGFGDESALWTDQNQVVVEQSVQLHAPVQEPLGHFGVAQRLDGNRTRRRDENASGRGQLVVQLIGQGVQHGALLCRDDLFGLVLVIDERKVDDAEHQHGGQS